MEIYSLSKYESMYEYFYTVLLKKEQFTVRRGRTV